MALQRLRLMKKINIILRDEAEPLLKVADSNQGQRIKTQTPAKIQANHRSEELSPPGGNLIQKEGNRGADNLEVVNNLTIKMIMMKNLKRRPKTEATAIALGRGPAHKGRLSGIKRGSS
jgi:hypothetical protein